MILASFQSEYLIKPWVRCSQFALTVIYFVTQVCRQIYRPISVIYRLKSQKSSSTNAFYSNAYGDQDDGLYWIQTHYSEHNKSKMGKMIRGVKPFFSIADNIM